MSDTDVRRLIAGPAAITLAVTLLRLAGELLQWSPSLFNRTAGGGGALVGIVWLVPVFGAWFALKVEPGRWSRALGTALVAFIVNTAIGVISIQLFPSPLVQLAVFAINSWLTILMARIGWPELWRVLLAYGFAARVPVVLVMLFSIFGDWDTHYTRPRPDFPAMGPLGLFLWTAVLPQLSLWLYVTVVGGMLFGAIALALSGRRPAAGV